jgi:hypothetical protein
MGHRLFKNPGRDRTEHVLIGRWDANSYIGYYYNRLCA